jgi:hypothetical protein
MRVELNLHHRSGGVGLNRSRRSVERTAVLIINDFSNLRVRAGRAVDAVEEKGENFLFGLGAAAAEENSKRQDRGSREEPGARQQRAVT